MSQVDRHLSLALHCLDANRLQVNDLVSFVMEQSQRTERLEAQVNEQSQQIKRLEAQVRNSYGKEKDLMPTVIKKQLQQFQQIKRLEAQVRNSHSDSHSILSDTFCG